MGSCRMRPSAVRHPLSWAFMCSLATFTTVGSSGLPVCRKPVVFRLITSAIHPLIIFACQDQDCQKRVGWRPHRTWCHTSNWLRSVAASSAAAENVQFQSPQTATIAKLPLSAIPDWQRTESVPIAMRLVWMRAPILRDLGGLGV